MLKPYSDDPFRNAEGMLRDPSPFGRCKVVIGKDATCDEPLDGDAVTVCPWHLAKTLRELKAVPDAF